VTTMTFVLVLLLGLLLGVTCYGLWIAAWDAVPCVTVLP